MPPVSSKTLPKTFEEPAVCEVEDERVGRAQDEDIETDTVQVDEEQREGAGE